MITCLYILFMIGIVWLCWKLIKLALKAAWGITKILLFIVVFPIVLVLLAIGGFIFIALPLLVIGAVAAAIFG